jgi:uncharacterized protein YndB with AHSA1/START domain
MDTPASGDCSFVHTRRIEAAPAAVFAAFADAARLARWWGPEGFSSRFEVFDLRPGGAWRFVMRGPDGSEYRNENRFIAVEPPTGVEIEHLADAHHFRLMIRFTAEGDATRVHWVQTFDTPAHRAQIAQWVEPANEQNLDRLAREVAAAPG